MTRRGEVEALREKIEEEKTEDGVNSPPNKFPFFQLPLELVCEIFSFAIEANPVFPFIAASVSKDWRAFTLSKPEYWQCLVLSKKSPQRKVPIWIERCKGRITDLRIREDIGTLQLDDVMKLFSVYPDIFKHVKNIHIQDHMHRVLTILLGPLDLWKDVELKELWISSHSQTTNFQIPLSPFILPNRDSGLTSLSLEWVAVEWDTVFPQLTQLRTLVIRINTLPELPSLLTLFQNNPNLCKVVLEGTGKWSRPQDLQACQPSKHDIQLPDLRHLEFTGDINAEALVECLSLPRIQHLILAKNSSLVNVVIDKIDPKPLSLKELNVNLCRLAAPRMADLLKGFRELEKVELTHSSVEMGDVVDSLAGTYEENGEVKFNCPHLQSVNFSHCTYLNGGPIVRLVKSRLTTGDEQEGPRTSNPSEIKEIIIDHCPRIDPSVPAWLRNRVARVSCVYMTKKEIRKIR